MTTETAKNIRELAAELLTVLSRIEPKLDAAARANRKNTLSEYWYHDDTTQIVRDQRRSRRKVETDVWRLARDIIDLGYANGVRVLDDVPPDAQERICDVLGIRPPSP
jgi:hypothetical protein